MRIQEVDDQMQKETNKICNHFEMRAIPVYRNSRLRRTLGIWRRCEIELSLKAKVDTLLHELAHHLHETRYIKGVKGYYKAELWNKQEAIYCDIVTKRIWYGGIKTAKNEQPKKKLIYLIKGTSHGKEFEQCLRDIEAFYGEIGHRRLKDIIRFSGKKLTV